MNSASLPLSQPRVPDSSGGQASRLTLFELYPKLEQRLPHVSLGTFPTPVHKLLNLGKILGLDKLYIKRDDLSGTVYGGNKVRKLEFLLGEALQANVKEVMTVGFAGSNHALATAIYAQKVGLRSTSLLLPQLNAGYVRRNLLASYTYHARLCYYKSLGHLCLGVTEQQVRGIINSRAIPQLIPAGGSSPIGLVGYVNAAFELRDQIVAGELPEPDLIYVPLGSMGTASGLMLGLKAAGLKTRVIPVRVIEERMASPKQMVQLIRQTARLLSKADPSFPHVTISESDLSIRKDCLGEGYACFTEKAVSASHRLKAEEGILLNGAYSAKAFSALLDDAAQGSLKGKTVLYWNTYNSRDLSAAIADVDYRQLPRPFHRYFEEDVQPLDRESPCP
jgi:1-aminocyclopropane-1-carboxylate deaminase/D-cysteine desulfhydrase-like pyridoxal-dependent ACC family enzyme